MRDDLVAVILAGGEGTRLRPLTLAVPKPILPIANIPGVEYILRLLKKHGISRAVLSTGHLAEACRVLTPGWRDLGIAAECRDEDKPLGTCGAVKKVADLLEGTFLVFNGDVLTDVDLTAMLDFHREKGAVATLALTSVEDPTAYGLVPLAADGRIQAFIEKPSWDEVTTSLINAGTYILEPEVLESVAEGTPCSFERELFPGLLERGEPIYGFPYDGYWLDVGTAEKYRLANHDVLSGKLAVDLPGTEISPGIRVGEGTHIHPEAKIFPPAVIGAGSSVEKDAVITGLTVVGEKCVIGESAEVESSILLNGCRIGPGAVISHSILGNGVHVGSGSVITEGCVLADEVEIGEDNGLTAGIRIGPRVVVPDRSVSFPGM